MNAPLPPSASRRPFARDWLGASVFGGLVWFPAGLPMAPLAGLLWLGEAWLRVRVPWLGWLVTTAWCAVAVVTSFTLGRLGPFLAPRDWLFAIGAGIAGAGIVATPRLRDRRRVALSACLGLPLALAPPMVPGLWTRLAILTGSAAGFWLFQWLVGERVGRRMAAPTWGFAVLVPSIALRALLFWLLPTADAAPILAQLPGARLLMPSWPNPSLGTRYGMPINWHDLRVGMQGCEPGSRIVGTLEALYFRAAAVGEGWSEVRFPPGDQLALDCARGKLWVPEMVKEKLWSVDLTTHAIDRPFEHCGFAGPTVVAFDQEGAKLYGYPGGEHLAEYDPESHGCRIVVDGGTIMGFSVSRARNDAIVVRNGRVERCHLDGGEKCDVLLRLYDERLPRWLQTDRWNKATFVNHFNKVLEDPVSKQIFATSLQSGRLYRVDRESGVLTGSVFLEPGIRWVQLDSLRRRIYVGGFVRGHLFVVDADTLALRARAFVGRKIRYFEPLSDGSLVLASSAGVLELDPARLAPLDGDRG